MTPARAFVACAIILICLFYALTAAFQGHISGTQVTTQVPVGVSSVPSVTSGQLLDALADPWKFCCAGSRIFWHSTALEWSGSKSE